MKGKKRDFNYLKEQKWNEKHFQEKLEKEVKEAEEEITKLEEMKRLIGNKMEQNN